MASTKLSIRLLKQNFTIDQSLKNDITVVNSLHGDNNLPVGTLLKNTWLNNESCTLYTGMTYSNEVSWKNFIIGGATRNIQPLYSSGSSALLYIPVFDRIMVISFGMGHHLLKPDCFEIDFGVKVVLNSIEHDKIKSLDIRTNDDIIIQKRVQTSKQTMVSTFGINIEQDILKTISAKPSNREFATNLNGGDSLSIHCDIEPTGLISKCEHILNVYNSVVYLHNFEWYDNIKIIRQDNELIIALNNLMYRELRDCVTDANNSYNIYLAYPEIVDYDNIETIKYTGFNSRTEFDDLNIQNYIEELQVKAIDLSEEMEQTILRHVVNILSQGNVIKHWKLYDCLVYETSFNHQKYILSSGQWYQVSQHFTNEIDIFFDNLSIDNINLPDALINENEEQYNARLSTTLHQNDYVCMDRDLISGIEACDFYTPNRHFIHIKDEAKSSKLSHLFNQGVVSAEIYLREKSFRRLFKKKILTKNRSIGKSIPRTNLFNRNDYEIVYAIMRKPNRNGNYDLPFFSKIALRNSVNRLHDLGYNVSLSWIKKIL